MTGKKALGDARARVASVSIDQKRAILVSRKGDPSRDLLNARPKKLAQTDRVACASMDTAGGDGLSCSESIILIASRLRINDESTRFEQWGRKRVEKEKLPQRSGQERHIRVADMRYVDREPSCKHFNEHQ